MLLTGMYEIEDRFLDRIFNSATRNRQVKIDDPKRLEKVRQQIFFRCLHKQFFIYVHLARIRNSLESQTHIRRTAVPVQRTKRSVGVQFSASA